MGTAGETVLAEAYAQRKSLKVGSSMKLNDKTFSVVGLAKPPLGGQSADVYLTLGDLQALSARAGRVNVVLVRADSASQVSRVEKAIGDAFPGAQVSSAKDLADRVSGSLVDASKLASTLGVVLAAVALAAAFLIAGLLTAASVAKRVRELGTLKAIGWKQKLVVRQIVGESLVQGVLGGVVGSALGIAAAAAIAAFGPTLNASAAPSGQAAVLFGLGRTAAAAPTITSGNLASRSTLAKLCLPSATSFRVCGPAPRYS
jgi:ABC-type lipoprotein release transport system permease subunit